MLLIVLLYEMGISDVGFRELFLLSSKEVDLGSHSSSTISHTLCHILTQERQDIPISYIHHTFLQPKTPPCGSNNTERVQMTSTMVLLPPSYLSKWRSH